MRSEASTENPPSRFGTGEATEYVNCTKGAPGSMRSKASRRSRIRVVIGLVMSGNPETTAAAGCSNSVSRSRRML